MQTASGMQCFATCPTTLIALSVEESPDLILHAMRAGCTEYLTKPLQVEAIGGAAAKVEGTLAVNGPAHSSAQRDGPWDSWEFAGAPEQPP